MIPRPQQVLLYPTHFKALDITAKFKAEGRVGFNCASGAERQCLAEDFLQAQAMFRRVFGESLHGYVVPVNALSVSIAAENFNVGKNCFEFVPDQGSTPDSFLSYQLLSERVHATYYNENGVEYLAGITYFMQLSGEHPCLFEQASFDIAWCIRRRFPDEHVAHDEPLFGRDCETIERRALVGYSEESAQLMHYSLDYAIEMQMMQYCFTCATDKDVASRPVVVPCWQHDVAAEILKSRGAALWPRMRFMKEIAVKEESAGASTSAEIDNSDSDVEMEIVELKDEDVALFQTS
ncbi:unnamed protein product [Caenorhabditis sp. 36 PRJEB53466]|nr:unnamed protein product [Caenorhabditis sp. 36 PRJEB53466]